jgi:hypothetical protein
MDRNLSVSEADTTSHPRLDEIPFRDVAGLLPDKITKSFSLYLMKNYFSKYSSFDEEIYLRKLKRYGNTITKRRFANVILYSHRRRRFYVRRSPGLAKGLYHKFESVYDRPPTHEEKWLLRIIPLSSFKLLIATCSKFEYNLDDSFVEDESYNSIELSSGRYLSDPETYLSVIEKPKVFVQSFDFDYDLYEIKDPFPFSISDRDVCNGHPYTKQSNCLDSDPRECQRLRLGLKMGNLLSKEDALANMELDTNDLEKIVIPDRFPGESHIQDEAKEEVYPPIKVPYESLSDDYNISRKAYENSHNDHYLGRYGIMYATKASNGDNCRICMHSRLMHKKCKKCSYIFSSKPEGFVENEESIDSNPLKRFLSKKRRKDKDKTPIKEFDDNILSKTETKSSVTFDLNPEVILVPELDSSRDLSRTFAGKNVEPFDQKWDIPEPDEHKVYIRPSTPSIIEERNYISSETIGRPLVYDRSLTDIENISYDDPKGRFGIHHVLHDDSIYVRYCEHGLQFYQKCDQCQSLLEEIFKGPWDLLD